MFSSLYSPMMHPVFLWAFAASCMVSIIGGIVGSYIVVKRITLVSGSIAHALLSGAGLALFLAKTLHWSWLTPFHGACVAAAAAALLLAFASTIPWIREDALITTLWAAGMATGIIFIAKTPGYTTEINALLVGNILWVSAPEIGALGLLAVIVLMFTIKNFQPLKVFLFDPDQALLQGVSVRSLYGALLLLVAAAVVALTQLVGIVLVLTMLTLPQMCALLFCSRLRTMMIFSLLASIGYSYLGLTLAFFFDLPAGATITLVATATYALCFFAQAGILAYTRRKERDSNPRYP